MINNAGTTLVLRNVRQCTLLIMDALSYYVIVMVLYAKKSNCIIILSIYWKSVLN